MQPSRIRIVARWIHLSAAVLIGIAIYFPWSGDPVLASALSFGVFPLLCLTGSIPWPQARLRRLCETSRSAPGANRP